MQPRVLDLNAAVRRLFDTGLFRDVRLVPGGGELVVEVVENPSINEIAFEGNKALKDDDLKKIIQLKPRLPFTPSAAAACSRYARSTSSSTPTLGLPTASVRAVACAAVFTRSVS